MIELPKHTGTYALVLSLKARRQLSVGQLGQFGLLPGTYIYLGSAFGSGGLRARLRRHLAGVGSPHWHIDALRKIAHPLKAIYTTYGQRLECDWSQALLALPGAFAPIPGFGASDCLRACPAHLVGFQGRNINDTPILDALKGTATGIELHAFTV